jgi:hypothetical protein
VRRIDRVELVVLALGECERFAEKRHGALGRSR